VTTLSLFTELLLQMAMSADWGKWQRLKEMIPPSC
jgi:hypothetical protein